MNNKIRKEISGIDSRLIPVEQLNYPISLKRSYLVLLDEQKLVLKLKMIGRTYYDELAALEKAANVDGITHLVRKYDGYHSLLKEFVGGIVLSRLYYPQNLFYPHNLDSQKVWTLNEGRVYLNEQNIISEKGIIEQAQDRMTTLHALGIAGLQLHLGDILVTPEARVYFLDFDMSKTFEDRNGTLFRELQGYDNKSLRRLFDTKGRNI